MNITRLEQLLKQEESENLEFKREIHLDTNQGKAKFVKELLALANSTPNGERAYLIVGVEDKTGKLIGIEENLPEEKIQQIMASWCRPPVSLRVETQTLANKRLGVITIYGGRGPHTPAKNFHDPQGGLLLRETDVYIRRGSTVDVATPAEVIAIAQARPTDMEGVEKRLDHLNDLLEEWKDSWHWNDAYAFSETPEPNRFLETAFLGMASLATALWFAPRAIAPNSLTLFLSAAVLLWSIGLSTLQLTHFGLLRSLFTTMMLAPLLALCRVYLLPVAPGKDIIFVASVFLGGAAGVIAAGLLTFGERQIRR